MDAHKAVTVTCRVEEAVFAGVHKFPGRVKCSLLPWHAVVAAVEGKPEPVTTESEEM